MGELLTPFAALVLTWMWTDLMWVITKGLGCAQRKSCEVLVSLVGIYSPQKHQLNVYSVPGDSEMNVVQFLPSKHSVVF